MTTSYTACCRSAVANEPTVETIRFGEHAGETFTSTRRICAACRQPITGRLVYINTHNNRNGSRSLCGAACLGGKVSCDCRCNGRCHGADTCYCNDEAGA